MHIYIYIYVYVHMLLLTSNPLGSGSNFIVVPLMTTFSANPGNMPTQLFPCMQTHTYIYSIRDTYMYMYIVHLNHIYIYRVVPGVQCKK